MDASKLSDEQLLIADKIIEEAKRSGVDPNLALSVASAENAQFNPKAISKKNAIGIMQLTPDTAKYLKVDPHDVDENIHGGIKYLKENLDRFGDLNKALAGYNAGPYSKFFKTENIEDVPSETLEYIDKINSTYRPGSTEDDNKKEEKPFLDRVINFVNEHGEDVASATGLGAAKGVAEKILLEPKAPIEVSEKNVFNAQQEAKNAETRLNAIKESALLKGGAQSPIDLQQSLIAANDELRDATEKLRQAHAASKQAAGMQPPTIESITERLAKAEAAESAARAPELSGAQKWLISEYGKSGSPEPLPASMVSQVESMSGETERGGQTLMRQEEARRALARRYNPDIKLYSSEGIAVPSEVGAERLAQISASQKAEKESSLLERQTAAFAEREAEAQRILQAQQDAAAQVQAARQRRSAAELAAREAKSQASEFRKVQGSLSTREQNYADAVAEAERLAKERRGPLSRFLTGAGYRTSKMPIFFNTLGGLGTGLSFADAVDRYKQGDRTGAVLSAIEGGLSVMSMAPPVTPLTAAVKGIGTVGGLALTPVILARDYLRNRQAHPE
jgi:hypothetical protein